MPIESLRIVTIRRLPYLSLKDSTFKVDIFSLFIFVKRHLLNSNLLKSQSEYQSNGRCVVHRRACRKLGDSVLFQVTDDCGDAFFCVAFSLSGGRECVAEFIAKLPLVKSGVSDDGIFQADSEKQMVEIFTGIDIGPTCDAGTNIIFVCVVWYVILCIR